MIGEKLSRNDACHCGSGKKYKKCCLRADETREHPTGTFDSRRATERPTEAALSLILSDAPVIPVATRGFPCPANADNPPPADSVRILPVEVHVNYTYCEPYGVAEVGYIFPAGHVFLTHFGEPILNDDLKPGMRLQLRGGRPAFVTGVELIYEPPDPSKSAGNGLSLGRIIGTVKHRGNVVMDVSWPGYTATCTPDHRYYSVTREMYVPALALRAGELLRTPDGKTVPVLAVSPPRRGLVDLYNLEVESFHNYFVGGSAGASVLVHNGLNCIDTPIDLSDVDAASEIETGFQNIVSEEFPNGEHQRAAQKGYPGIKLTGNGGPDFAGTDYLYQVAEGQRNIVRVKINGTDADFDAANAAGGFESKPDLYTWHHVDDFDPITGEGTLQLVLTEAHVATYRHYGGAAQARTYGLGR